MIPATIQKEINTGGALTFRHPVHYPARYNKQIPLRVRMKETVMSDLPLFVPGSEETPPAIKGNEYYVKVNSYGAVTALFESGACLGLKSDEFEVVEFHQ